MDNLKTTCTMAREHTPFLMVAPIKVNFTRTGIHEKEKKLLPFCSFFHFSRGNAPCLLLNFAFCVSMITVVFIFMLHSVINSHKLSTVGLKERVRSTTSKAAFGLGHFPALKRWD